MKTLSQRLRYAREQAGLSQSALARQVGLRPQAIQLIEAGRVQQPRNLVHIAAVLKVNPLWLANGEGGVEALAVREPATHYARGRDASPISREALALARQWMQLSKSQRDVVRETIVALLKRRQP